MTRVRLGSFVIEHNERNRMNRALPVYSVTNSQGFCQQYFNKVVASEDRSTYKIVPRNCFAYNPSRINVGSIDWQRYEESVIVSPLYVVFNTSDEMDNQFLYYYLKSDVALTYIKNWGQGSVRDNLKFTQLSQIPINVYPIEEQQLIAQRLDVLSKLISLRQRQAEKLDELVKARFVEMFGGAYSVVIAEDVCEKIVDCPHSTPQYNERELKYPAIRTSEIQDGQIEWSSMKYVGINEYQRRIKRLIPEAGDIVYAREGTYGDCVILPEGYHFCLGQRTMLFRPNYKLCNSEYLHAVLRSAAVKYQADMSNAGSTVPHVNVSDAKRFHFPLPPLPLQNAFATFVHEVDREKERIQRSAALLETLKRSLMQQYFG